MRDNGWRRLNISERIQASERVKSMPEETAEQRRAKAILTMFVNENMSASAICRAQHPDIVCMGNRSLGKPLSVTSVLEIIYRHFPEWRNRRAHVQNPRADLIVRRQHIASPHVKRCAFCGNTQKLEEHHMIPLFMGGTNDERNLIFLCHDCHVQVSAYQRQLCRSDSA